MCGLREADPRGASLDASRAVTISIRLHFAHIIAANRRHDRLWFRFLSDQGETLPASLRPLPENHKLDYDHEHISRYDDDVPNAAV
jgi:hypothetical protein